MSEGSVASNAASTVAESAHHVGSGVIKGISDFGKSAFFQLFGKSDNENLKHHEIKQKGKEDDSWSAAEYERIKKVKAAYDAYYAQQKKLKETEEKHEEEREEFEEINEKRVAKSQKWIGPQVAKTRAEIGRNYGQE